LLTSGVNRSAIISSVILAVIALSLVVVTGYAGRCRWPNSPWPEPALPAQPVRLQPRIPFPIAPLLAALERA